MIEAIDWAVEHRQQYNVRVINLSLGAPVLQPYRDDPLCEAVERAGTGTTSCETNPDWRNEACPPTGWLELGMTI